MVLFLHGFGADEQDLPGLAPALGLDLPWASLRAPLDVGSGAAWFAVTTPGSPDPEVVEAATGTIWDWVDANLDPGTRVVPIGFSQGGLMATQLLRTRPERVLAPVVLAGFVLVHPSRPTTFLPTTAHRCYGAAEPTTASSPLRPSPGPSRGCRSTRH